MKELRLSLSVARQILEKHPSAKVYFVGGCFRDMIFKSRPKDFDLVVDLDFETLKSTFDDISHIDEKNRCIRISKSNILIDVSVLKAWDGEWMTHPLKSIRIDKYALKNKHDLRLFEDFAFRDYYMNAIYLKTNGLTFGGHVRDFGKVVKSKDLKFKKLINGHEIIYKFENDPVKLFRGIKYAIIYDLSFGYHLNWVLKNGVADMARIYKALLITPIEKLYKEIDEWFTHINNIDGVQSMYDALHLCLHHSVDVYPLMTDPYKNSPINSFFKLLHNSKNGDPDSINLNIKNETHFLSSISPIDNISLWTGLFWMYIMSFAGNNPILNNALINEIEDICIGLTMPNKKIKDLKFILSKLILLHNLDNSKNELESCDIIHILASEHKSTIYKLRAAIKESKIYTQFGPAHPKKINIINQQLYDAVDKLQPEEIFQVPYISGDDLINLDIKPGPIYSTILDKTFNEQLNGNITNKEDAIKYIENNRTSWC